MAEEGKSLEEIAAECRLANDAIATFANALTPCTVPGSGPLFEMKPDEIDIGLGIHGEAGILRTKVLSVKPRNKITARCSLKRFKGKFRSVNQGLNDKVGVVKYAAQILPKIPTLAAVDWLLMRYAGVTTSKNRKLLKIPNSSKTVIYQSI